MKTLVIFYSYTGHTKALAQELADKNSADILEIKDVQRPTVLKAYTLGGFASMRGKSWPIQPLEIDWTIYERLSLFSPVWAGGTPPAVNALLEQLPKNKIISVKMISASGHSGRKTQIEEKIKSKACKLESIEDIKA